MLKKVRIIGAALFFFLITILFLDFTGIFHVWFDWMAKIQFIPAVLSGNVFLILGLIIFTLLFGRIYCSVICPLGILQDGISNVSGRRKGKKNRFRYSSDKTWLRYGLLGVCVVSLLLSVSAIVSLLVPYAIYGRVASNLFSPVYRWINNLLAWMAERVDSYSFYSVAVWIKGGLTFALTVFTLMAIGILAWRNGRTYCNTICPVGTILGFLSKFSLFRITFDVSKCTKCKACERTCKASCIDVNTNHIDRSRCVTCFNCVDKCKYGALKYVPALKESKNLTEITDISHKATILKQQQDILTRRNVFSLLGLMAMTTMKAQQLHVDGGLAEIEDKKIPDRKTPILPPGSLSAQNMKNHCTACQLCVSACPNDVLRPSNKLAVFMQPEMSYERGYCRPECTECSKVCPTSAIKPVSAADKSGIAIGLAVWITENCVVNTDEIQCDNCERHCPTGAITLIDRDPGYSDSLKIPTVDKELCIGCGACENLCPARPFSAIYVEGNVRHHSI